MQRNFPCKKQILLHKRFQLIRIHLQLAIKFDKYWLEWFTRYVIIKLTSFQTILSFKTRHQKLKPSFIYSEKATKFDKITTLFLKICLVT